MGRLEPKEVRILNETSNPWKVFNWEKHMIWFMLKRIALSSTQRMNCRKRKWNMGPLQCPEKR